MAVTLTINGVSKSYVIGSLSISELANGRATASFSVRSNDGTYRPALDAPVVIMDGATTIFTGPIDRPSESGTLGDDTGAHPAIVTQINAVDANAYIDRRIVLTTIPAGTTKAALTQLIAEYWAGYGMTLDAGQVDGPSLPYIEYGGWKGSDALNDIAKRSAGTGEPFVWRVSTSNVLRMFQPSTQAAPFNISEGDGNTFGDVTIETDRDSTYANKIIGRSPATTTTPDLFVYAQDLTEQSAHGIWDKFLILVGQPSEAAAQAIVDAELARSIIVKQVVKYKTFNSGLAPGQTQTIYFPSRNINATGVVTELVTSDYGTNRLTRSVTLTIDDSQTNLDRSWGDTYKMWARDTVGGGNGQAVSTVFAPADPIQSVQFHDTGDVFGGDASFIYYKDENSVVCGVDSSITAALFESCQVFGEDCHISD
jgi:hypothetical protein